MTDTSQYTLRQPLQQYVIRDIHEHAGENDNFAIVQSNNDFEFAETLEEANERADDAEQANDHLTPQNETVAIIELQPTPPEA